MSIDASTLRRLAALRLDPEAMSEVLSIIADVQDVVSQGKTSSADRQRRYRERNALRNSDVTVTRNSDVTPPSPEVPPCPPYDIKNSTPLNPPPTPSRSPSLRSDEPRSREDQLMSLAEFGRFWNAWPHKVGKPIAAKSFFKVWREADAILAGVERYIRDKPVDRPWLNPATFLHQRRWEDRPASVSDPPEKMGGLAQMMIENHRRQRENEQQFESSARHGDVLGLPFDGEQAEGRYGNVGSLISASFKRV